MHVTQVHRQAPADRRRRLASRVQPLRVVYYYYYYYYYEHYY